MAIRGILGRMLQALPRRGRLSPAATTFLENGSVRTLAAVLAPAVLFQDGGPIGKAARLWADVKSYHWRIQVKNHTAKTDDGRAGEFLYPNIITFRKGVTEIAKRRDKAMVNQGKGWKPVEEIKSREIHAIVEKLDPPHEELANLSAWIEKPKEAKKPEDVDGVSCRVYTGGIRSEHLKSCALRAIRPQSEKLVVWPESRGTARVFVSRDDRRIRKILFQYEFKVRGFAGRMSEIRLDEEIYFFDYDTVKLDLPEEVKKALDILD